MRPILLPFLFLTAVFNANAQSSVQQKNDSVCLLVKEYINERSIDKLYQLTGKAFQQQLSPEKAGGFMESRIFPLGAIKATAFEKMVNNVSLYKADFSALSLYLLISLDSAGKLETFGFRPYKDEQAKKNYRVPSSNPLATPLDKRIDTIAASYIDLLNTVGISIGILKEGKTYFYGYGETAKGNKVIPDPATIFEIGSISKTFTATLLAIAVGEAKVRLDDPVNKYLPDSIPSLQYNNRVMTLRDLSNHTSATPYMPSNFQDVSTDPGDQFSSYSIDNLYSFLRHLQLTREPGKQYEYSNTAVGLLGTILQKIYHSSYEALILKYICDPLSMTDTRVSIRKDDSSAFAKGYDANGAYTRPWNLSPALAGAGAIRSTARDMLKYADANMVGARGALGKAIQLTHDTTFANDQISLGLGWHYIPLGDKKIMFHNGGTGGYRSYLAIDTQKKIAVVILGNSGISLDEVGIAIMKKLEED